MRTVLAALLLLTAAPALAAESKAPALAAAGKVEIKVTDEFSPREIKVKKGQPVTLVFTRTTEQTCITAVDIPDEQVKGLDLPLNKPVAVTITPRKKGVEKFHCSAMGMGDGKLVVED